jgi:hypothetical protein
MELSAFPDVKLLTISSLSKQPSSSEELNPAAMRLIIAAISHKLERNPTEFLAACAGFSPGG